ncbi:MULTISPECIES: universal stress protein [unclassified Nocardiopsis]|uniref:universal stress protein n=1 Tax=Nocardiopsis TaxID=2013 RepID=UPI00387AED3A
MTSDDPRSPKIVLGVDGSGHADAALEWAVAEATRTGRPLDIVFALPMPLVVMSEGPSRPSATQELIAHGEQVLGAAADRVRGLAPGTRVEVFLAMDDPVPALLERAGNEDLLVVGSRGLGALRAAVMGSTAIRLAARAHCPVAVVPESPERTDHTGGVDGVSRPDRAGRVGRIVVGVDGSEASLPALRFALGRAHEDGSAVTVVHSWEVSTPFAPEALAASGWVPPDELLEQRSGELVAALFEEVGDAAEGVDVSVVRSRQAAERALLAEAEKADLVVVGSRGRGGLRGLFLGSVSQAVLHGAAIPVVVIPHRAEDHPETLPWSGGSD